MAHQAINALSLGTVSSIAFSKIMKDCSAIVPVGANHDASILSFYLYSAFKISVCDITANRNLAVLFDFTILIFTVTGLRQRSVARFSPLWSVIYRQGYAYVGFAAALDIPMLVCDG